MILIWTIVGSREEGLHNIFLLIPIWDFIIEPFIYIRNPFTLFSKTKNKRYYFFCNFYLFILDLILLPIHAN